MRKHSVDSSGSIVFFVIILIAVLAGGAYFLFDMRKDREAEARAFAREIVQRVAVQKDQKYLHSIVAGERRAEFTLGREEGFIETFKRLGTPQPGWDITGNVVFQNQFFSPVADFKSTLTYPERHATVTIKVASPRGRWELEELALTYERTPEESAIR